MTIEVRDVDISVEMTPSNIAAIQTALLTSALGWANYSVLDDIKTDPKMQATIDGVDVECVISHLQIDLHELRCALLQYDCEDDYILVCFKHGGDQMETTVPQRIASVTYCDELTPWGDMHHAVIDALGGD